MRYRLETFWELPKRETTPDASFEFEAVDDQGALAYAKANLGEAMGIPDYVVIKDASGRVVWKEGIDA